MFMVLLLQEIQTLSTLTNHHISSQRRRRNRFRYSKPKCPLALHFLSHSVCILKLRAHDRNSSHHPCLDLILCIPQVPQMQQKAGELEIASLQKQHQDRALVSYKEHVGSLFRPPLTGEAGPQEQLHADH